MAPARMSNRSDSVLLPWSMWAIIEKFLICIQLRKVSRSKERQSYGGLAQMGRGSNRHAEVLRSIWPIRAIGPDASEYLSMTIFKPVILFSFIPEHESPL